MHFNILRQSGIFVYVYFKIYFYMPNFASIGRVDLVLSGDKVLSTPESVGGSVVTAWLPGSCMQLLARSGARHPAAGGWARVPGTLVAAHLSGAPGQWSLSRTTPPAPAQHPTPGSSANIVNIVNVYWCQIWRNLSINDQSSKGLSKESQLWTYWCSRKIPSIY